MHADAAVVVVVSCRVECSACIVVVVAVAAVRVLACIVDRRAGNRTKW